jgi:hypothetical protein
MRVSPLGEAVNSRRYFMPSRKVIINSAAAAAILAGILGGGVAWASATPAPAPSGPAASNTEAPEPAEGAEGAEADGPGGHEDPAGANVDHQFEGKE